MRDCVLCAVSFFALYGMRKKKESHRKAQLLGFSIWDYPVVMPCQLIT